MRTELHEKTRTTILTMDHETALIILEAKWITPILDGIGEFPEIFINGLIDKLSHLADKYHVTFTEVGDKIEKTEKIVSDSVAQLQGSSFDMEGFAELQKLLGGVAE